MNRDEQLVKVNEAVSSQWHSERIDAVMALLDQALSSQAEKNLQPLPTINGLDCPACGHPTLFLGEGGYVTCSLEDCPNPDYAAAQSAKHERELVEAEIKGLQSARHYVIRRTEIPKDARNPTRDLTVIIGEECARIITERVGELKAQLSSKQDKVV